VAVPRVEERERAMTPERHQQIQEVFHAALEREPAQRGAYLDAACRGDAELRRGAESLLAAHQAAARFWEASAGEARQLRLPASEAALVGRQIGWYKLLQEIGRGGMGEVWLAEDTQLGRKVAVKLLPAAFTHEAELVRRFAQEARAASSLNHPNILTIHE